MNSQLVKPSINLNNHPSIVVDLMTSLISSTMAVWSFFIRLFSSKIKSTSKKAGIWASKKLTDKNDFFEENAFYTLFQNKELFEQTYGHNDNPLIK